MSRKSPFPGRDAISLPLKDALRGTRAILKRASDILSPPGGPLPPPLQAARALASAFAKDANGQAFEAASLVRAEMLGDGSDAGALAQWADGERMAAVFAGTYRQAMAYVLMRIGAEPFFLVSETLAAAAYWSGYRKLEPGDPLGTLPAQLYGSLVRHHVAAVAPGTPIGMSDRDLAHVKQATFAVLVWLLVARRAPQDNEIEILGLCADVAMSILSELEAVEGETALLARLMLSYAEVI